MNRPIGLPNSLRPFETTRPTNVIPRPEEQAEAPFNTLLDAARISVRSHTLLAVRESPQQMFEPKATDPGDRRKQELRQADADDRESTSLDLRSAPGESVPPVGSQSAAQTSPASNPKPPEKKVASNEAQPKYDEALQKAPLQSKASPLRTTKTDGVVTRHFETRESSQTADRSPTSKSPAAPPSSGAGASNVAPAPFALKQGVGAERSAAQSIGEILGGKSANGDGAPRANAPVPSTQPQRPAVQKPPQSTTDPANPSGESRPSENMTPTETDAARSPFERLVRSIRLNVGERFSTARMELDPPELGRMRVQVHLRGDAVELEVRTTNGMARDLVAARADELKLALEQHGIRVQRLVVSAEAPTIDRPHRMDDAEMQKRRRGNRLADERSELRRALTGARRLDVSA